MPNCQSDIERRRTASPFFQVILVVFYIYVFYQCFCHHTAAPPGYQLSPDPKDTPFTASFIIPHKVLAARLESSRMRLHGVIDVSGLKKFTGNYSKRHFARGRPTAARTGSLYAITKTTVFLLADLHADYDPSTKYMA